MKKLIEIPAATKHLFDGYNLRLLLNGDYFLSALRDFFWYLNRLPIMAKPWVVCVILQKFHEAFPDWRRREDEKSELAAGEPKNGG